MRSMIGKDINTWKGRPAYMPIYFDWSLKDNIKKYSGAFGISMICNHPTTSFLAGISTSLQQHPRDTGKFQYETRHR